MSDADHTAIPSQTVGPFFHCGLATDESLGRMASEGIANRIRLRVRVLDGDGVAVPDGLIELYQADAEGRYPAGVVSGHGAAFTGFGRLATDEDGVCVFDTVRPGAVTGDGTNVQAPHILVCLFARGLLRHLHTRTYFAGDIGHDRDPVLRLVPADRRPTLMAHPTAGTPDGWDFVIRLQGEDETVFFDL